MQYMFMDLPLITAILTLTQNCQAQIDHRLICANAFHIRQSYKSGLRSMIAPPNSLSSTSVCIPSFKSIQTTWLPVPSMNAF